MVTGKALVTQLQKAVIMHKKHSEAFEKFSTTFPADVVAKWDQMVDEWDNNKSKPNPYEEPIAGTTMTDVKLELAKEEEADAGRGIIRSHETSPSTFLTVGLDLEEQQQELAQEYKKKKTTTLHAVELLEKRNSLRRRIETWREVQVHYMPGVAQARASLPTITPEKPETMPLCLPSIMPSLLWATGCLPGILAQADDALAELRRQLRIAATICDYKKSIGPSQKLGLRTCTLLNRFHDKTLHCARRYSAAFEALKALDPNGDWTARLRHLDHACDIRGPHRDEDDESEGRREMFWIWLAGRADGQPSSDTITADEISTSMRVEWVKSKARAERWREETILLAEEMRRVIAYFDWKAKWWISQKSRRPNTTPDVCDGIAAYSAKQARLCHRFATSFARQWYSTLIINNLSADWPAEYVPIHSEVTD
ncbi:hypothetical protein PILCRDRAFT_9784 [Piloderma croceum F 1598]|uniref:Uncharacterized protein n=1 Tax=Piloderma croceum (strain F 1598) TaxID=765440 RepID=A0A0C3F6H3_PILCF|nr:hypothetical protein PILCRDRAFT_9784 [Piloderma croceum F 1598]